MKFQSVFILFFSLLLFSCQDETKIRLIEQQKEAKKKEKEAAKAAKKAAATDWAQGLSAKQSA